MALPMYPVQRWVALLHSGAAVVMAFMDSQVKLAYPMGIGLATLHTALVNTTKLTQLDIILVHAHNIVDAESNDWKLQLH